MAARRAAAPLVAHLVQAVARDIASTGRAGEAALNGAAQLAAAGAVPEVVAFLFAEYRRKRPDSGLLEASNLLLHFALDNLRLDINSGDPNAPAQLRATHDVVTAGIACGDLPPDALLGLLHSFARAKLEPCEALKQAAQDYLDAQPEFDEQALLSDLKSQFATMAQFLGNDSFLIHSKLEDSFGIMPATQQRIMVAALADNAVACLRQASLGFGVSGDAQAGAAALRTIAEIVAARNPDAGAPASQFVSRLAMMRAWVGPTRQTAFDAVLDRIGAAATPPLATKPPDIDLVLATFIDGAGSTSVFATFKAGRTYTLAGFLLKTEKGIVDAWLKPGLGKSELAMLTRTIDHDTNALKVSIRTATRMLANALATNLEIDTPPPFGLVNLIETLGLGKILPQRVSAADLIAELLGDLPADRITPKAAAAAQRKFLSWTHTMPALRSWFEGGEVVNEVLRLNRTLDKKFEAIIKEILPARRHFWATACAWAALLLRQAGRAGDETWIDMALIARDLNGNAELRDMDVVGEIAMATIDAYKASTKRR